MYDRYLIETQGFQNIHEGHDIVGFEFQIKIAYYRGVALTILARLSVWLDGAEIDGNAIRIVVNGRVFTLEEASHEETVRWEFGKRLTVRVLKAGGLNSGRHAIRIQQRIRPAYLPPPIVFQGDAIKSVTLVGPAATAKASPAMMLGVSLYSYQEEYYTGAMNLEDCLAEVAAIKAKGVQLLPEQMMEGYPNITDETVSRWHAAVDRYGLTPTAISTFVDTDCGGHRIMTIEEGADKLIQQMKLAKRLGFSIIRPTTGPVEDSAPELIQRALPHAEKLGVSIAPEIHAPIPLTGRYIESYVDLIEKTQTAYLGFTLDLGIFCREIPWKAGKQAIRLGAQPEIVEYVNSSFKMGRPFPEVIDHVFKSAPNEVAIRYAYYFNAYGPSTSRVEDLAGILPYVKNVHGKFYEMSEDMEEQVIPYGDAIDALAKGNYRGSIDSEYEGQRLTHDSHAVDSCEQVRRQHVLLRRLLS